MSERVNKNVYCDKCNDYVDYIVKKRKRTINVKGTEINVIEKVAYCKHCGEQVWADPIEKENDINVYNAYKKAIGLLTTDEIISIRKKRKMTQKELAEFLRIGEKDIARYENGAIQTKANDLLIRLVADENTFLCLKHLNNRETKPDTSWCNFGFKSSFVASGDIYFSKIPTIGGITYGETVSIKSRTPKRNECKLCY